MVSAWCSMKCKGNGKVRYRTPDGAAKALVRLNNAGLDSYRCRVCKGWHVGHSSKPWKKQARIDQLLAR